MRKKYKIIADKAFLFYIKIFQSQIPQKFGTHKTKNFFRKLRPSPTPAAPTKIFLNSCQWNLPKLGGKKLEFESIADTWLENKNAIIEAPTTESRRKEWKEPIEIGGRGHFRVARERG